MTMNQFIENHKEAGLHWFDWQALKFFNSKILEWNNETGYFFTSEIDPSGKKMYSIRKANFKNYDVETIGEFHSHKSLQAAKAWLAGYIEGNK